MQRYEATAHESRCDCCGPRVKFDECHDGDWVRHDDAQAEIARLRAELDAARERFARVVGVHRCQCCGDAYEFTTQFGSWRTVDGGYQHKCPESDPNCGHFDATFFPGTLSADLDSARAALDKERDATCSIRIDIADIVRVVAEMPRAKADVEIVRWTERLQAVVIASARRAASPTEPPR